MKPKIYIPIIAFASLMLWFSIPFFGQLIDHYRQSPKPIERFHFDIIDAHSALLYTDLSTLKFEKAEDNSYNCYLPFEITEPIPPGHKFWLIFYQYPAAHPVSFSLYKKDCDYFPYIYETFIIGKVECHIITQDDINVDVLPGAYYVRLYSDELPDSGDMARILVGFSDAQFIEGFLWSIRYAQYSR